MEIEALESVCAAHSYGSYAEAAFHISVSPSVISRHVSRVEDAFGISIFQRATKSRPLELTEDGKALMTYLAAIVAQYKMAQRTVEERKKTTHQTIRIGYAPLIGNYFRENLMAQFALENPNVNVFRYLPTAQNLEDMLLSGSLDVVLVVRIDDVDIRYTAFAKLLSEDVTLIPLQTCSERYIGLPKEHPLAQLDRIPQDKFHLLYQETLIMPARRRSPAADLHMRAIAKFLGCPDMQFRFMDFSEPSVVLNLVEQGQGIIWRSFHGPQTMGQVRFVPLAGWTKLASLCLAFRTDRVSGATRRFAQFAQKYAAQEANQPTGLCGE